VAETTVSDMIFTHLASVRLANHRQGRARVMASIHHERCRYGCRSPRGRIQIGLRSIHAETCRPSSTTGSALTSCSSARGLIAAATYRRVSPCHVAYHNAIAFMSPSPAHSLDFGRSKGQLRYVCVIVRASGLHPCRHVPPAILSAVETGAL